MSIDIEFLTRHGVCPARLTEAMALARRWGVPASDVVLSTGLVAADEFYRALAAELGLPFCEPGFAVHALARYPAAILSGIAPLDEALPRTAQSTDRLHVFAPRGAQTERLLRSRLVGGHRLAITTPQALREAVLARKGQVAERLASEDLPRRRPDQSFHGGLTLGQLGVALAASIAVSVLGLADQRSLWLLLMIPAGFPFLALAAIKIAAVFEPAPIDGPACATLADSELPVYSVLVALYREARVLPKLRRALLALDYPAAKLDVKLLIEESDAETRAAIAALDWPSFIEILTLPEGLPRTKPRALNLGLALARGRYLVVYDAEDVPDPAQLREAAAHFARLGPDVACLQARLVIDNTGDSVLAQFFTLEYGGLFDVLNPALARSDLPVPLGGTSNHLDVATLRRLGGWDPWNVTEDADLGMRLAIAGYRVADLPSATLEEAPTRLSAWLAQRARWMKGYVQVAITHSRRPGHALGRLGPTRFVAGSLLIGGAVMSAAIYPIFALLLAAQLWSGAFASHETVLDIVGIAMAVTLAAAGILAMVLPAVVAVIRRGWWFLLPLAPLMPLYYVLVSLGAWRGLIELALAPDRWNKTEHGFARTSRQATAIRVEARRRAQS